MRYCQYCGMPMEDDDLFCTRCGKAAKGMRKEKQDRETGRETGRGTGQGGGARMRYVSAGSGSGKPAGREDPGKYGTSSGRSDPSDYEVYEEYEEYDEYEEEERGRKRMILIISGLAIVVVVGVLIGLLLTTGQRSQDPARQADVSTEDPGRQEGSPVSGQESKTAKADGAGENEADGQKGQETDGSGKNESQKSPEKESGREDREAEKAADRGKEERAAEEKAGEDEESAENREPAAVKTEQNEEVAEGIEALENKEQADQENEETKALDGSYILADSNSRLYSREELERMDNYTLQMAINEIYARHGRKFKTDSIREYFEGKSWYRGTIEPEAFDGNEGNYFNEYESANRELMARIRASREEKTTRTEERGNTREED